MINCVSFVLTRSWQDLFLILDEACLRARTPEYSLCQHNSPRGSASAIRSSQAFMQNSCTYSAFRVSRRISIQYHDQILQESCVILETPWELRLRTHCHAVSVSMSSFVSDVDDWQVHNMGCVWVVWKFSWKHRTQPSDASLAHLAQQYFRMTFKHHALIDSGTVGLFLCTYHRRIGSTAANHNFGINYRVQSAILECEQQSFNVAKVCCQCQVCSY
jgi:hypothetical protein